MALTLAARGLCQAPFPLFGASQQQRLGDEGGD